MEQRHYKKLIGARCYLSPFAEEDAALFTRWLNDMEVTRTLLFFGITLTLQSEKEWIAQASKGNDHHFTIVTNENDRPIGNCAIKADHLNRHGEVGILIGEKDLWGNGYGTEALMLLLDYGFNALNLNCIELSALKTNTRALRCYEKAGFKYAGTLREKVIRGGEAFDLVYMDILAKDFKSPYVKEIISAGKDK